MQENFVNIFHKFDFERQKMAEEKQGGKIITPLGWENNSQNLKVDLTQRSNKKADLSAKRGVLSWVEFQQSDEFKAIKRQKMPNGKWQFVPNNEQLRKLVCCEEVSLGEIDTSEVTDMSFLFAYVNAYVYSKRFAQQHNIILEFKRKDFSGIAGWDTSRVTTFGRMFHQAINFNQPLNQWNTSSVTKLIKFGINVYGKNSPLKTYDDENLHNKYANNRDLIFVYEGNEKIKRYIKNKDHMNKLNIKANRYITDASLFDGLDDV